MFETSISNNGIIVINRGDTFTMRIAINFLNDIDLSDYEMGADDKVYFAICEPNQHFEEGVIRKIFTMADLDIDGNIKIELLPSDTYYVLPGTYYYEIKLKIGIGETAIVKTIVSKRKLVIC